MNTDYDVIIVGLGPAGATLARLLAPHMRVLALDRKTDTSGQKPCGGLLAPDAQKALARFDLTLPNGVLADPQIFSVDVLDLDSGLSRRYQRFYINMDRHKFDRWLRSFIPASVRTEENAVCTHIHRKENDGFTVQWRGTDKTLSASARYIVGADGASSLVRQTFFPARHIRRYTAVQQWFQSSNPSPSYGCVFDSHNTDCYSWYLSKDGYWIFGGAYPVQNSRVHFENQKQKLASYGFDFSRPIKTEACQVLRPATGQLAAPARNGVFLTGEAAGWVSPSSLEGISSALRGALLLARALQSSRPEKTYNLLTLPLRLKLQGKLFKCPFLYRPFLRRMIMQSGLRAL